MFVQLLHPLMLFQLDHDATVTAMNLNLRATTDMPNSFLVIDEAELDATGVFQIAGTHSIRNLDLVSRC